VHAPAPHRAEERADGPELPYKRVKGRRMSWYHPPYLPGWYVERTPPTPTQGGKRAPFLLKTVRKGRQKGSFLLKTVRKGRQKGLILSVSELKGGLFALILLFLS